MEKKKKIGYDVGVEIPHHGIQVFCVDGTGKIRGWYQVGCRHYMSDYELWGDWEGLGTMRGEFKRDRRVSAFDREGRILEETGYNIDNLRVSSVREVDIDKMISDPYIAGLDRPIYKPGSQN